MPASDAPNATLPWAVRLGDTLTRFPSLSQLARWSISDHGPSDSDLVTLYKDNRPIFTGLWGGGLQDQPTLM